MSVVEIVGVFVVLFVVYGDYLEGVVYCLMGKFRVFYCLVGSGFEGEEKKGCVKSVS